MSTLTEPLADEFSDVGYDPENYEPPKRPLPPIRGVHPTRIVGYREPTANGGIVTITTDFAIVRDDGTNGKRATFQRIQSRPFKTRNSSQLGDLLAVLSKALERTEPIRGLDAIKNLLDEARDRNITFKASWDWSAFDKDAYRALKAEKGVLTNEDYKTLRIDGQRNFTPEGTATFQSGNQATADAIVTGFVL